MAEYRQWREIERERLKDVIPLATPYNLSIEVSSLCNFRCIYCAHSGEHNQYEGNMSDVVFDKIVSDIHGFSGTIKKCGMFGFGESLCNPKLPDMIKKMNATGKVGAVDLTTNGYLITPERADALIDAGIDTLRISLQGINVETYKRICGVDIDFDMFLRNLKYLYENRGKTKIRMKIADLAIKDIPSGQERFEELFGDKADSIFVEHIMPIYSNISYDKIDEDIKKEAINGREKVAQSKVNKVCHRAFYRCRVRANGDVTAACCDSTQDILFGNILNDNLVDIWNGPKRNDFLIQQLRGKRFQIPECVHCMMPNDITTEDDLLDPWMNELISRFL